MAVKKRSYYIRADKASEEMSFLVDKIKTAKKGERLFCRTCRRLIREDEQYRVREEPKPFRRVTDWRYTHHPRCPK